jgi:hypothetical protein
MTPPTTSDYLRGWRPGALKARDGTALASAIGHEITKNSANVNPQAKERR